MRARADADVIPEKPIVEVMTALSIVFSVCRDFVPLEARGNQMLLTNVEHFGGVIVFRQWRRRTGEYSSGLECELVMRDMSRMQSERRIHVCDGAGHVLIRQRIHQIQIEVVQTAGV